MPAQRPWPAPAAVVAALSVLAWSAPSARTPGGPIARGSGAAMCGALTQADFAAVGLQADARAAANVQDNGQSAYCVFRGRSGALGGLELDVFWPAGANPREVRATEQTVLGEDAGSYPAVSLAGADEARIATSLVSGGPRFAAIVVRRRDLVFTISLPAGAPARSQLLRLAAVVLRRLT